jgi:hypothetical protein
MKEPPATACLRQRRAVAVRAKHHSVRRYGSTVRTRLVDLTLVMVDAGGGRSFHALDLVDGWGGHVFRFLKELSPGPAETDPAGGVHDC